MIAKAYSTMRTIVYAKRIANIQKCYAKIVRRERSRRMSEEMSFRQETHAGMEVMRLAIWK